MIQGQIEGNVTFQIRGAGTQKEGTKRRTRRGVGERVERVNRRKRIQEKMRMS